MSQATTNPDPSKLPVVFAKITGNKVDNLKKNEFIWHCQYEKILNVTVVFINVEQADNEADKALFEKSTRIYLENEGYKVQSTKYHNDASVLKQYLTMK